MSRRAHRQAAGDPEDPADSRRAGGRTEERPSFRETFVAVGQQTLDKSRYDSAPVVSVAVAVTVLMVLAAVAYTWLPWLSVTLLVCAVVLLWGRWMILRQVTRDLAQMESARESYVATGNPEYPEFVRLRAEQMLRDNRALTTAGRRAVRDHLGWARRSAQPPVGD